MIGLSPDNIDSHCSFADAEALPFPILTDEDSEVRAAYGVKPILFGLLPDRATFVIDRDRKIRHAYRSHLFIKRHVDSARNALETLNVAARVNASAALQ